MKCLTRFRDWLPLFLLTLLPALLVRPVEAADCVLQPPGLINFWPAENSARDRVGTSHGTLQNGATFADGLVGRAFSFDGVDDYVSVPDSAARNFGTGDFAIEFWCRSSTGDRRMQPVSLDPNYGVSNLDFDFNDPDTVIGRGKVGLWVFWNGGGAKNLTAGATGAYTDGNWHHFALTRTGTTLTLYVDGAVADSTITGEAIDASTGAAIGAATSGMAYSQPWQGLVDEVSIYNRSISAADVAAIHAAGSAGKCAPGATIAFEESFSAYPSGTLLSAAGWTMHCSFGDCGAVRITDRTAFGDGNPAVDGSTGTGRGGYIGAHKAFGITVAPGDNITLSARLYTYAEQNTVWVGLNNGHDGFTGDPEGIHLETLGAGSPNGFFLSLGRLGVGLGAVSFGPPLQTGIYEVRIQVDGGRKLLWAEITPPSGAAYTSPILPLNGQPVEELNGFHLYVKNFGAPHTGDLDDFRVVLNGAPLPACAPSPAGMVAWWPGDLDATDRLGGNPGTLLNGATFAVGKVGPAFSFDGNDDTVQVPDSPALRPQQLTVEAWVFAKSGAVSQAAAPMSPGVWSSRKIPTARRRDWELLTDCSGPALAGFSMQTSVSPTEPSLRSTVSTPSPLTLGTMWR